MFELNKNVRFSDCNVLGKLSVPAVINYFQNISEAHAETLGDGNEAASRYVWILNSWQIVIKSYPSLGDRLRLETRPHSFRLFEAQRNFIIFNGNNEAQIYANSFWTNFDKQTFRPAKITNSKSSIYNACEPFKMDYAPRKIYVADISEDEFKTAGEITVRKSMLDMNAHMNNMQYVLAADDFLDENFSFNQIRVEYKKPALKGDKIIIKNFASKDRTVSLLISKSSEVFAIVEFSTVSV